MDWICRGDIHITCGISRRGRRDCHHTRSCISLHVRARHVLARTCSHQLPKRTVAAESSKPSYSPYMCRISLSLSLTHTHTHTQNTHTTQAYARTHAHLRTHTHTHTHFQDILAAVPTGLMLEAGRHCLAHNEEELRVLKSVYDFFALLSPELESQLQCLGPGVCVCACVFQSFKELN